VFNSLYRSLGVSLVLPLIAIQVLLHRGFSPIVALAVAAIFPLAQMIYDALVTKRVGVISVVSLAGIVVGFGLSFATGNALFALLKDSVFTGVFGLIFLGSLFAKQPLTFRLNLDLAGSNAAARAAAETLWNIPAARASFRLMTAVWGIGLLFEAAARVVAALTLPLAVATGASPVIAIVVIGGLLAWTVFYARARQKAAAAAGISVAG
jgi:hypothetical protein